MKNEERKEPKVLKICYKATEHANIVCVCDGAADVGQIRHTARVLLTNMKKARMCSAATVVAGSKPQLNMPEIPTMQLS